jgi:PAS domain S-box-containing protein
VSIKRKVFLAVMGASFLTVLAGLAAIRYLSLEGFSRMDEERASFDVSRAVGALDNELGHLDSSLRFRSSSDLTYRYAAAPDRMLSANYFSWQALKGAGLNMLFMFAPDGRLIEGAAYDLDSREALPLESLLGDLPGGMRAPQGERAQRGGKGVLQTPLGPMLVVFQPIYNSMGWGPSRGTLVAGRYLDAGLVARIAERQHVTLSIMPLDQAAPAVAALARTAFRHGRLAAVEGTDSAMLTAVAAYPDYDGVPALLVRVEHPRQEASQFRRAVGLSLAFMAVAGACVLAVTMALLRRSVLDPLARITAHIASIKDSRDLDRPLPQDRTDEIGMLAGAFNAMSADLLGLYAQLDRQYAMLRLFIDNIPHPMSVKDRDGRYLVANKALAGLLGVPGDTLPGMTDQEAGAPEDWAAAARKSEEEVRRAGKALFFAAEPFDQGAAARFFDTTRLPMDGSDRVLTVALDVTARIQSEERLKHSERRFRSLFESMTEGVGVHEMVLDGRGQAEDYRIVDVNPAYERILGLSRESVVGKLASDAYGLEKPPLLDVYAEAALHGRPRVFEYYHAPMGKHFSISAFSPSPGMFATVFTDTTGRRRTQEALNRARTAIQHILDSMPSPVIGLDEQARIAHMNAAASRLSATPAALALGMPLSQAFPLLGGHQDDIREALAQASPSKVRKLKLALDGELRLVDLQVFPMFAEGKACGAVLRLDDVTERVRMEEIALQTEKMLSVGGLAAGMAHEINNPLGGILQSIQIIRRRLEQGMAANEAAARQAGCGLAEVNAYLQGRGILGFLDAIHDSGARAAQIVANMLEFSRRSESKMTPTDLAGLLDKVLELAESDYDLKKKYDFRRVEVVKRFEQGLPPVRCTKTEIEQVVLNLIRNAAQAMGGAPEEEGLHPRITLTLAREDHMARIEVQDNGPGMAEAVRKRVFEPFFTTKPPGLGTGLGLSVSYFIVTQNHGGDMSVESEPGKGARFIVRLPFAPDVREGWREGEDAATGDGAGGGGTAQ